MFRTSQVNRKEGQGAFYTRTFDVLRDDEPIRFETYMSFTVLTLYLLMWGIWWAPNNARKGQIGFNLAFKGLMQGIFSQSMTDSSCNTLCTQYTTPTRQLCVTKTVGCGKNHKYTSIHNFYSIKYYKHSTYFGLSLHIKSSSTEKRIVF